jgi:hypothetical protein
MKKEFINLLSKYLDKVERNYPFEEASLKGLLEWLKKEGEDDRSTITEAASEHD